MPLTTEDFIEPTEHPFGMLDGYVHAFEKESVLQLILQENVLKGEFEVVRTIHSHPTMVEDGLLEEHGGGGIFLLPKRSVFCIPSITGARMDKLDKEPPQPNLTQALRVWAKKKNLRPVDFAKHMGWGYSHAWAVLKGEQHFSPEAHGQFIHVYGFTELMEIYKIARLDPKGSVDLTPAKPV